MDTTNDWYVVAGAIASVGVGWWLRGLVNRPSIAPAENPVMPLSLIHI